MLFLECSAQRGKKAPAFATRHAKDRIWNVKAMSARVPIYKTGPHLAMRVDEQGDTEGQSDDNRDQKYRRCAWKFQTSPSVNSERGDLFACMVRPVQKQGLSELCIDQTVELDGHSTQNFDHSTWGIRFEDERGVLDELEWKRAQDRHSKKLARLDVVETTTTNSK